MQIDARNLACPRPVVLALEALPKLAAGESLEVLVNDEVAPANLTRLAAEKDCEVATADHGDHVSVMLTPRSSTAATDGAADTAAGPVAAAAAAGACPASEAPAPAQGSVVLVGADSLGRGSEELGHKLLGGLIYAFAHQDPLPKAMVFFNGGAHLTCEGSESLADVRDLESKGCEILTCGTCLDFYGIRDQLGVGGVTNLYRIAEIMATEPNVVSL
ncbi:sulfurtransferase-like selenium metabolism protein YedF [Atopobiaceae bacterium LCP21S3_F11]